MKRVAAAALIAGTAICLFGAVHFLNPLSVGVSIASATAIVLLDRWTPDAR